MESIFRFLQTLCFQEEARVINKYMGELRSVQLSSKELEELK